MLFAGVLLAAVLTTEVVTGAKDLEVLYQWPVLTWDTPAGYPRVPDFESERAFFTGIEIGWDRVFLALPRFYPGLPATVAWIPRNKRGQAGDQSPPLRAYPSWEWHAGAVGGGSGNCSGIISVFRIRADRCNRLWVLDSGVQESIANFNVVCPPKILIFDLTTDRLVRVVNLPPEVVVTGFTLLTNLLLDEEPHPNSGGYDSCDNLFVYLSDPTSSAIIVYDGKRDTAWRLSHPYMYPDPFHGKLTIAGESFTLMDGVLGTSVHSKPGSPRKLFFQPFASNHLFSIPTAVLQGGPNLGDASDLPVSLEGDKSSQAAPLAKDPLNGALLFSPVSETAIASWIPGSRDHQVIAYSPKLLQGVLDIRPTVRDNPNIWLISTKIQKMFRGTVNPREINLRIMRLVPKYRSLVNNTIHSPVLADNSFEDPTTLVT